MDGRSRRSGWVHIVLGDDGGTSGEKMGAISKEYIGRSQPWRCGGQHKCLLAALSSSSADHTLPPRCGDFGRCRPYNLITALIHHCSAVTGHCLPSSSFSELAHANGHGQQIEISISTQEHISESVLPGTPAQPLPRNPWCPQPS